MAAHAVARLAGGRLHLQHGPIDLVIGADGAPAAIESAYAAAQARFAPLLGELVAELPSLRTDVNALATPLAGTVARRMLAACVPFMPVFITPMAAVAGAVADEVLAAMRAAAPELLRAYVNNGGDIALHLAGDAAFEIGLAAGGGRPGDDRLDATVRITATMPVRGVATSGWRGRSFSLGIADSVTVLAADGAAADAAATMIGNAVNIEHDAIERRPACEIADDTDLGELRVTTAVGALDAASRAASLDAGAALATRLVAAGRIHGCAIMLQGASRAVGAATRALPP